MSRTARIALATVSVLVPLVASAGGYGKSTWGMTHEQVEKLYPGGIREAEPDEVEHGHPHGLDGPDHD